MLLKRAEESRQVVLGPLTVRVASEKCCWCTVRATMGCVPAKRVQSSVADERSSAVHSTGSIPTTPILSASEDKTSPEGVRRSPERFVRTSTPRPPTCEAQSPDSGIHELYEEYAEVITEFSAPERIRIVELEFIPVKDIELVVEGKQCPRRLSGKDRERHEQEVIINKLRTEGLVLRPESKASGGVAFELVSSSAAADPQSAMNPVRQLPPLLQKRKKKNKEETPPDVTEDSIRDKLEKATQRKKKREQEKIKKMKTVKEHSTPPRKPVEEPKMLKHNLKMAVSVESREQKLQEKVQKLKERDIHAKEVRRKKLIRGDAQDLP